MELKDEVVSERSEHFSITQLTTYLNCPASYRYGYIENIPWEFQSADLVFGNVCHQTIAHFHHHRCELDLMVADFEISYRTIRGTNNPGPN